MKPVKLSILLLICCSLSAESYGQLLPFRSYSIELGLSESLARTMVQDERGYIWVGTGYGLNRFDGRRFRQFYEEDGLSANRIFSLYNDHEAGVLWIGTEFGVTVLENDTLYTPASLAPLHNFAITAIHKDRAGRVWIGTDANGIWRLGRQGQLISIHEEYQLPIESVRTIAEAQDGAIWLGAREGLARIGQDDAELYSGRFGVPELYIRDMAFDSQETLYIGTRTGLVIYDGQHFTEFAESDGLSDARVLSVTVENDDKIWLGTENGISLFDGEKFQNYGRNEGLPGSLIHDTMHDREGNMWFGSLGGITLLAGDYFRNFNIENGLPNNVVTGFMEDSAGNTWIATYGGGAVKFNSEGFAYFDESNGLKDNKVYCFLETQVGQVWIGTSAGISVYENGRLADYTGISFPLTSVRKMFEDTETGIFWLATYNDGIFKITADGYEHYHSGNGLLSNTVMDIKKDKQGNIWFATYGGAAVYDGEAFQNFTVADGLQSNGIIHIHIDQDNVKWFSSFGGVAKYNGEQIYRINESEASEMIVYFVVQDLYGRYFAGTTLGFFRFDPDILLHSQNRMERLSAFRLYNRNQGLLANELNAGGSMLAEDGTIWLGTVGGISRFFPDQIRENSVPPGIEFDEILMSGELLEPGKNYTFRNDQNFLQISYLGLNFEAPDQLFYEYRMNGLNQDWQLTRDTQIRYPSLSPGEYEFQLRVYNADGVQSLQTAGLHFTILAPFYMRWWFLVLMVLLIIVVVMLVVRYLGARRQIDIERMRVQIASDLHDDVGSTLTELALQTDFLQAGDVSDDIRETLKNLGDQSRKVVNSLDDIVWSIDSRNDTAGDVTDRMQDYVNQVLSARGIQVMYNFDNLRAQEKLPVDVKENIYLIFKEAVNNIAKHSKATLVEIIFSFSGKRFDLTIRDNGKNAGNNRKTGQGLRNMKMRARRIGANVNISAHDGFTVKASGSVR